MSKCQVEGNLTFEIGSLLTVIKLNKQTNTYYGKQCGGYSDSKTIPNDPNIAQNQIPQIQKLHQQVSISYLNFGWDFQISRWSSKY